MCGDGGARPGAPGLSAHFGTFTHTLNSQNAQTGRNRCPRGRPGKKVPLLALPDIVCRSLLRTVYNARAVLDLPYRRMSSDACAVIILGFAFRRSEAFQLRIEHGLREYHRLSKAGRSVWLVVTGGDTQRVGETEAHHMARVATAAGVPTDRIILEDEARYTIENALFVRRAVEALPERVTEAVLVTNAFHMERSLMIFAAAFDAQLSTREEADGDCVLCQPVPLRSLSVPDGSRLKEDTGKSLDEWAAAERLQLELVRSENGTEVGNLLSQRLRAHEHLGLAAKAGNVDAMIAWRAMQQRRHVCVDEQRLRNGASALHCDARQLQTAAMPTPLQALAGALMALSVHTCVHSLRRRGAVWPPGRGVLDPR